MSARPQSTPTDTRPLFFVFVFFSSSTCARPSHSRDVTVCRNNSSVTKQQESGGDAHRQGRSGMEESFETFGEEFGAMRSDRAPQRPLRQIRRPETYAPRKIREDMIPAPPTVKPDLKNPTKDINSTTQPAAQSETSKEKPWENVTLNRCLFVAISILLLTSGFQRLHATLRGQRAVEDEEDDGVRVRCYTSLRNRARPELPENSLWDVMSEWLPDFSDDDEDDDDEEEEYDEEDGEIIQKKPKSKEARASSGLRNKPIPSKFLLKPREDKPKRRKVKKQTKGETAERKHRREPQDRDEDEEMTTVDKKEK